jgi:hypothetical protein
VDDQGRAGARKRRRAEAGRAPGRPHAPAFVRIAASCFIVLHLGAVLTGAFASVPYSTLERSLVHFYRYYFGIVNQGYAYRYYSRLDTTIDPHHPNPWGTPIVVADLEFDEPGGGSRVEAFRLPERPGPRPRLRFQRQLDLAFYVTADPRWAASYARHLFKTTGCSRLKIYSQYHYIPNIPDLRDAIAAGRADSIDLESPGTYGPRRLLGEFECDQF